MEYTASHKNSFKRWVKDGILHYDTPQILALIQPPVSINNCFFGIKRTWRTFDVDVNLEIKLLGTVLNKMFLIFQTFCSIVLLRMKNLKKKHSQVKILQNLRILPCQNALVVDFFCQSFCSKRILTSTEYCNLQ